MNFSYKATRDIVSLIINVFFFIIVLPFLGYLLILSLDVKFFAEAKAALIMYIVFAILVAILSALSIFHKHFKLLVIRPDEVVYMEGIFFKSEVIIPASKIRSCKKYSGPLQRLCKTMDISITTAGDYSEIYFCNIGNGMEALEMLSELAKKSEREH